MRQLDIKTKYGRDRYCVIDGGELKRVASDYAGVIRSKMRGDSSWYGRSYEQFAKCLEIGDNALVKDSEEFMRQIEDVVPLTRGWRNVDDVVGGMPIVPAYLAGHPLCMRRRERTMKQTAPLVVYMDLTSSGMVSSRDVQKRGVALLALVRQLAAHRPVELWIGASLGGYDRDPLSGTICWRIDTAPLDLARAAFYISATVMSRGFGYSLAQHLLGTGGSWPFNDYDKHCRTAKERLAAVFPGKEIMYVPPIMGTDELVREPVKWLKRTLAQYVQKAA